MRDLRITREDIDLVEVDHAWVWKYRTLARAEGVTVEAGKRPSRWFRTTGSEAFIGDILLSPGPPRHARLRGLYVFKEWRGEGIGLTATRRLFDLLLSEGVEKISIYDAHVDVFEPVGFKTLSEPWPGTFYMEWHKNG